MTPQDPSHLPLKTLPLKTLPLKTLAVIPARYGSTRFPGKPLADMHGKPMIVRVIEQARQATELDHVIVATDDARIQQAVEQAGYTAQLTRSDHPSGTDRVWEVAQAHPEYDLVLNLQGDEPAIHPELLNDLVMGLKTNPTAQMITPITPIKPQDTETLHNPNVVKAVISNEGKALYFSRSPIPYPRHLSDSTPYYRHIGLYGFHRDALQQFTQWAPSKLEQTEQLEQLRALAYGLNLYTIQTCHAPVGVDTPEDLLKLNKTLYSTASD